METVGFIGLGNMGGPVAGHIQRAGYPMVVYDLRVEATLSFRERGAAIANSPAELAHRSDVIITALPMPKDVEQVACGANGILDGIKSGSVYIDISTDPPSLIRKLDPLFRAKGSFVLDAPVASGQPGAERGIHEVMVGGERETFERVKPILAAFGDQVLYAGPLGSGCICKLMHQMIGSVVSQAIGEGLTLGVKAGVDPKVLWDACAEACWEECMSYIIKCRRQFFAVNSKRIPFLLSCYGRMSAWQPPWAGSLAYRCHWPTRQSKN